MVSGFSVVQVSGQKFGICLFFLLHGFLCKLGCFGKSYQFTDQFVLQIGCRGLLTADSGIHTGFIASCLLALKTKHI